MEINIMNYIDMKYIISHILLIYLLLTYITKNPKNYIKISLSFSGGVILGLIYNIKLNIPIDTIIVSFLVSNVGYNTFLKPILKILNINYNNNKGIL
jgi:hypothetical protein